MKISFKKKKNYKTGKMATYLLFLSKIEGAYCRCRGGVCRPYCSWSTPVLQLEYARIAIGVRPYRNCRTVCRCPAYTFYI